MAKQEYRQYSTLWRVDENNRKYWIVVEDGKSYHRKFNTQQESIEYFKALKILAKMRIQSASSSGFSRTVLTSEAWKLQNNLASEKIKPKKPIAKKSKAKSSKKSKKPIAKVKKSISKSKKMTAKKDNLEPKIIENNEPNVVENNPSFTDLFETSAEINNNDLHETTTFVLDTSEIRKDNNAEVDVLSTIELNDIMSYSTQNKEQSEFENSVHQSEESASFDLEQIAEASHEQDSEQLSNAKTSYQQTSSFSSQDDYNITEERVFEEPLLEPFNDLSEISNNSLEQNALESKTDSEDYESLKPQEELKTYSLAEEIRTLDQNAEELPSSVTAELAQRPFENPEIDYSRSTENVLDLDDDLEDIKIVTNDIDLKTAPLDATNKLVENNNSNLGDQNFDESVSSAINQDFTNQQKPIDVEPFVDEKQNKGLASVVGDEATTTTEVELEYVPLDEKENKNSEQANSVAHSSQFTEYKKISKDMENFKSEQPKESKTKKKSNTKYILAILISSVITIVASVVFILFILAIV